MQGIDSSRIAMVFDEHRAPEEKFQWLTDLVQDIENHLQRRTVFILLYYTGARVNELRSITHGDVLGVIREGSLKGVLRKQGDAFVRVLPTEGREALRMLESDIDLLFNVRGYGLLGESSRKPGQVMHEKAWIAYINGALTAAGKALRSSDLVTSHSFRVGFISRLLRHTESHNVARMVGHKNIATTLRYNRYTIDKDRDREILDRGYGAEQTPNGLVGG